MIRASLEKGSEQYRGVFEENYSKNTNGFYHFLFDPICRSFSQQIFFVYFYIMSSLGMIDTPEKITEIFKIQYNFFSHLNLVYQSVSVHFENAAASLRELLNEFEKSKEEVRE